MAKPMHFPPAGLPPTLRAFHGRSKTTYVTFLNVKCIDNKFARRTQGCARSRYKQWVYSH